MKPIFLYGSLRDRELLEIVIGRRLGAQSLVSAIVDDFVALRHARADYPILLPAPGARAEGVLFHPGSPTERERLEFYECVEYDLSDIVAQTAMGTVEAQFFSARPEAETSRHPWDLEAWASQHRSLAIEAARELMDHHGRRSEDEIQRLWPGILNRARARVRASETEPVADPPLRTGFAAARDVEWIERHRVWSGYLEVEEHLLRHRRHDGGWTAPLSRMTVSWGDAVTILAYDPKRDRVLLLEQFRPGPAARGDTDPWCVEVIAGRIDADGDAEATARREAREEAGIDIRRIIRLPGYYPTPGLASEHLAVFVGEAELPEEGGLHGLLAEGEDIRTIVLPLDAALEALERGAINTGPAMIPLLWLARHRDRVRAEWS